MNQSFPLFELLCVFIVHWLILEPQIYVVVEQFGAENIPLLSGRLVFIYILGPLLTLQGGSAACSESTVLIIQP